MNNLQKSIKNICGDGKYYLKGKDLETLVFQDKRTFDIKKIENEYIRLDILSKNDIEKYICSFYPYEKQQQDTGWKDNFRTKLVAGGVTDIDTKIVQMTTSFLAGGKTIEDAILGIDKVVLGVDSAFLPMYKKLVKIAVKSEWMLNCINAGKTAIENNVEADYPVFPKFD